MVDCILLYNWDQTCTGIKLANLKIYAIRYARLTLDQTCKTCNPSVPKRSRGADYQIAVLGGMTARSPLIYSPRVCSEVPVRFCFLCASVGSEDIFCVTPHVGFEF